MFQGKNIEQKVRLRSNYVDSGIRNEKKNSKIKQSENREFFKKGSIKFQLSFIVQKKIHLSKQKKIPRDYREK